MKLNSLKQVCSIQVTCWEKEGGKKLEVEMAYEGDPTLASYLLLTAQERLEEQLTSFDQLPEHNSTESTQKKARRRNKKTDQNKSHHGIVEKAFFSKKPTEPSQEVDDLIGKIKSSNPTHNKSSNHRSYEE